MGNNIVLATMILQMKNSFARKTFQFTLIAQPVFYTFITYYMFKQSTIDHYISYVLLGSGLLSLWSCIVFSSAGDIDRERWMGTLSFLFASPTSFVKVIFAKVIGNTLLSLVPFIMSFVIITFIFKEPLLIVHTAWFVIIMGLAIVSFTSIAFLFASIFTLSRKASVLMNCLEYPIFIICGMAFPIHFLPGFIQYVSYLLSPTWVTILLRSSVNGIEDITQFYIQIVILCLESIFYVVLAYYLFMKVDKKVREQATLEVC